MKKVITFNDPSMVPDDSDSSGQFILCIHWLPEDERTRGYRPDICEGAWRDGKWWRLVSSHKDQHLDIDIDIDPDGSEWWRTYFFPVDQEDIAGWARWCRNN